MKLFTLFLLLLQFCSLVQLYSQKYFVTEEQIQKLEMNSKMQSETLNQQKQELMNLKNVLNESRAESEQLKNQLNESQIQIESLNNQLKKANESLRKSENSELRNKIFLSAGVFIIGFGVGTYATFRLR